MCRRPSRATTLHAAMTTYRALRGTRDILPDEVGALAASWRPRPASVFHATASARSARRSSRRRSCSRARSAGPPTSCARRCTRFDAGDESVTLRPENTAPVVRAFVEHALHRTVADGYPGAALLPRTDVPARAPAEGAPAPVPPDRRRGARGAPSPWPTPRRSRWLWALLDALGIADRELRLNSVGDADLPPALPRGADARGCAPQAARSCARTASAAARREPAARVRLQGRGGPAAPDGRARRSSTACARRAARTSTPVQALLRRLRDPLPRRAAPRARARLLPAHRLRGRRPRAWARRTRCSAADATTAWSRSSAGPPFPASASPLGIERLRAARCRGGPASAPRAGRRARRARGRRDSRAAVALARRLRAARRVGRRCR